jgi:hypothetical protein
MRGAGAIVFVLVFAVGLGLTLGSPDLPPGRILYRMLSIPDLSYPLLGVVIGVFNGVVYGIVVWLIFTLAARGLQ